MHLSEKKACSLKKKISVYRPFERWIKSEPSQHHLLKIRREATVTILIFTAVYALFNIPMAVCYILHNLEFEVPNAATSSFFQFDTGGSYFTNFVFNLAIPLNSTVNPGIYITRMQDFRAFILFYVRRLFLRYNVPVYF